MDALVSKAATILLSLHPGPASETSAFNRMRAVTFATCFAVDDLQAHPITHLSQAYSVVVPKDRETGVYVYCNVFRLRGVELNAHDNASRSGAFSLRRSSDLGWNFGLGFGKVCGWRCWLLPGGQRRRH